MAKVRHSTYAARAGGPKPATATPTEFFGGTSPTRGIGNVAERSVPPRAMMDWR